jgi:hypothetical protein
VSASTWIEKDDANERVDMTLGKRQAAEVTMEVLLASVPVADLRSARHWYEQIFGRSAAIVPNKN